MMHLARLTIILLLLLMLLPAQAQELYSAEIIDCPAHVDYEALLESEVAGETYECGVVVVPIDYDDPDGQKIELVYLRLFATGDTVAPAPLVYLSGGPGGSGLAEFRLGTNVSTNLSAVRQVVDVVTFDQRGTGLSYPLFCGPFDAAIGAALEFVPEDKVQSVTEIEAEAGTESKVLNYAVCFTGYESIGVDLAQWNSINSAHDIASLMTVLGYDQYNLMGTSYGTKLAQVAVRETPERIRSVVIDGVTPITGAVMAGNSVEAGEQYVRIFELCEADEACNAAFPNLEERFYAVLDDLATNPIELDEPIIPSGFNAILFTESAARPLLTIETIDWEFFHHLGETLNNWPSLFRLADFVVNNPDWTIETTSYLDEIPLMIQALEQRDVEQFRAIMEQEGSTASEWIERAGLNATEHVVEDENTLRVELENPFVAQSLTTLLGIANDMTASPSTPDVEWLRISLDSLTAKVEAGEDTTPIVIDMIDMLLIPMQGLGGQVFIDYANESLPEALATDANALIESMTPTQMRELRFAIYDIGRAMSLRGESFIGLHEPVMWAINCNESVAFRTQADVDAAIAAAAFPQMNVFGDNTWNQYKTICSFLPPTNVDPGFIEPIDGGDIPALIIQGKLDTHTPMSGALEVATYFDTSTVVLFDTEGHVVTNLSYFCPGIIVATFIDDPSGDIDTSCTADYTINFTLPE